MVDAYSAARNFANEVDQLGAAALREVALGIYAALPGLVAEAQRAALDIERMRADGVEPGKWRVAAARQARQVAQQAADEVARLMRQLGPRLDPLQRQAIEMGLRNAATLVQLQLPPGTLLVDWAVPTTASVVTAIGTVRGEPFKRSLAGVAPETEGYVQRTLVAGLLAGRNPGVVGRDLATAVGFSAVKADAVARQTVMQAYRVASLESYRRNGVEEFERLATNSPRTCAQCLAMDGTRQRTSELMAVHVRDRCTVVPVVPGYNPSPRELGKDWFDRQPEEVKGRILGPGGLKLYNEGVPLRRFVEEKDDPDWGPVLGRRPLSRVA